MADTGPHGLAQTVTNTCQTKQPIAREAANNADAHVAEEIEIAIDATTRTEVLAATTVKEVAKEVAKETVTAIVTATAVNAVAIAAVDKSAAANAVHLNLCP